MVLCREEDNCIHCCPYYYFGDALFYWLLFDKEMAKKESQDYSSRKL